MRSLLVPLDQMLGNLKSLNGGTGGRYRRSGRLGPLSRKVDTKPGGQQEIVALAPDVRIA